MRAAELVLVHTSIMVYRPSLDYICAVSLFCSILAVYGKAFAQLPQFSICIESAPDLRPDRDRDFAVQSHSLQ